MKTMQQLILLAQKAADLGEVPVAAAILDATGEVIAMQHNAVEATHNATAHAELLVIEEACAKRGEKYLTDCSLVVTLEPCAMCAGAIAHAKIKTLIFGAYDAKSGGVEHGARVFSHPTCHHRPEIISGVDEQACADLLQQFFLLRRNK
jgi:tRNA(adenine34) deaminase